MRILLLAPRCPFPPLERENIRPYHHVRFLSLRHDVDMVTFTGGGNEWDARRALRRFCPRVQILPLHGRAVAPATARHVLARQPLAVRRYGSRDLMERLQALNETRRYDMVFIYSTAMAPYGAAFPNTPKIVDLVEVNSLRWADFADQSRFPTSAVYRREGARLMSVETEAVKLFHRVLLASETEADVLRSLCQGDRRIASLKTPAPPHAPLVRRISGVPTVLIAGHMDHLPNRDAAIHFATRLFPRIRDRYPEAVLRIAGRNQPQEIRDLASETNVFLDDRPGELREHYKTAWVAVVPHRVSRGVRNEILEAMTLGTPTIVSREAFVGIDATPGTDLLVTDSDEQMILRICELFEDAGTRDRLGFRARRAMLNNYSHWSIALRLEELVEAAQRDTALTS